MLIQGDSRFLPLRDNSVQCVVTSPPYWGLRDYGVCGQLGLESTPEEYVSNMVAVFREVWRVLRDDGTVWCNLGDSYAQKSTSINSEAEVEAAVVRAELRNYDVGGWGATKRSSQGIGRAANTAVSGLKPKDLVGIPWRIAFALQADGWYLRSDIIWSKPNPMPESVTDRPTKAHEYVFLLSKRERYYFDQGAVREDGSSHREFWKETRGNGSTAMMNGRASRQANGPSGFGATGSRNIRTVWTIATQPYSEAHFATFPEALAKRCILAGCPVGGVVLDPFAGSRTTVKVAQDLGRIGVGVDLKPDYLQMACKRSAQQGLRLA